jgi:hypothetical protein
MAPAIMGIPAIAEGMAMPMVVRPAGRRAVGWRAAGMAPMSSGEAMAAADGDDGSGESERERFTSGPSSS